MMDVRTTYHADDLLVVANTRHGPGGHIGLRGRLGEPMHDHLVDPVDARRFLVDHDVEVPGLPPPPAVLDALRLIRRHVRALAGDVAPLAYEAGPAGASPDQADSVAVSPDEAAVRALFDRHPVRLGPDGDLRSIGDPAGWSGVVADLLPPLVEVRRERARLRMCGNPLCGFLFLDRSRNASRVWCDATICGNRVRGRRHRLRRLAG
jgi:hypothetical protein